MKKSLFTLLLAFLSMTLLTQCKENKQKTTPATTPDTLVKKDSQVVEKKVDNRTVYYVIVKAFKNADDAQKLLNKLQGKLKSPGIHQVITKGKSYYLLYDSYFFSEKKADKRHWELNDKINNDYGHIYIWITKGVNDCETADKPKCTCDECGPYERRGHCHKTGRWVNSEGTLTCRCSNCSEWAEGCDIGCECRVKDKVIEDY